MIPSNFKIQDLTEIARKAGKVILEVYNSDVEHWDVAVKDDNSPLTIADRKANDVICRELEKRYPAIPIISEENKEKPYEERKEYEFFFLVDPLDGTKEFIKRNGEFTVNIALIHKSTPVAGVVYAPVLNKMYYAVEGKGAFVTNGTPVHQLQVPSYNLADEGLRLVVSRSHMNEETKDFVSQFKNPETVSMGSSLKFMLVAENKADVYPRIAPTMEWDTGAAQAIIQEAGGKVVQFENNTPLEYNKKVLRNGHFVVYGKVE